MENMLAELPEGWIWATYEQIGKWSGGGTPSKRIDSYWSDGKIPWISPKDMKSPKIYDSEDKITNAAIKESPAKLIPSGSLVFVVRSGILRRTLPVGITKIDAAVNQDLKALTPSDHIFDEYLLYHALAFNEEIRRSCSKDGTTVESIEFLALKEYPIPVAPLHEQHRIVARIEELFSRLDAGVEALQKAKAQLKRYHQAVLKAAVEGRLTEEWRKAHPEVEPAVEFAERIFGRNKGLYESRVDSPYELPEKWTWIELGLALSRIEAGKNFRCEERPPSNDEVGVVKVSAVTWGKFDEDQSKTCTDSDHVNPNYFIKENDFLFSRANTIDLVGACVIFKRNTPQLAARVRRRRLTVDSIDRKLMLSDKILRFNIIEIPNKWILYVLRSKHGRKEIENLATGNQESMRNIGQDRIKRIKIPLPPKPEIIQIIEDSYKPLSPS